jgi:hypothetical protein
MVAQYLYFSDYGYDSGICDFDSTPPANPKEPPSPHAGARRQPAYDIWSNATSYPEVR